MSNTATVVNQSASSATNASVVLNDIIASGIEVSVTTTDTAAQNNAQTKEVGTVVLLQRLITERKTWEADAYRTSNEQLYALLQRIYNFYRSVSGTDNKLKQEQLLNYCTAQGFRFNKSSHLITKVVRCVFDDKAMDRRRVSTYSLVLRAAHKQVLSGKLKTDAIAEFVATQGGVEQVRLAKSPTALTPKQKAQAAAQIASDTIATVASETLSAVTAVDNVNKHAVLLAVQQADGTFAVKSLIYSDGVVNAALAAFYAKQQALQDDANAKAAATDGDKQKAEAVAAAVEDASFALAA
jgi:hypothetical protein